MEENKRETLAETSFLLVFVLTAFYFLFIKILPTAPETAVLGKQTNAAVSTTVSAWIGEHYFNLFGLTSPSALVTIDGAGIFDQTYADKTGYFEFNNRFSPFSPREACLTAKDQFGRLTNPVCLAPFPIEYNVHIGPVILPPTVSLNNPPSGLDYFIGDDTILSGQTIPKKTINLSFFSNEIQPSRLKIGNWKLIKPVEAFGFPKLQTTSDDKGNFSIGLPSTAAKSYRFFTQVEYRQEASPKSLTLTLKILPVWMIIVNLFLLFLNSLKPYILEILILLEISIIIYYFYSHYLSGPKIAKSRALLLREQYPLLFEQHPLAKIEEERSLSIH